MPSYKDFLKLLREGIPPDQIVSRMGMRPSQWRRMLRGKRLRDALKTEEDVSVMMAIHRIGSAVQGAADRFTNLMDADNGETVRKVCLALLHEGLRRARPAKQPPGEPSGQGDHQTDPSRPAPWTLLKPTTKTPTEESEPEANK